MWAVVCIDVYEQLVNNDRHMQLSPYPDPIVSHLYQNSAQTSFVTMNKITAPFLPAVVH